MSDSISLLPGDVLRIERRYLVDGVVSTTTAEGQFAGVERVGSAEYVVIRGEDGETKLIPLANVSEITLVHVVERAPVAEEGGAAAWDPGVA